MFNSTIIDSYITSISESRMNLSPKVSSYFFNCSFWY